MQTCMLGVGNTVPSSLVANRESVPGPMEMLYGCIDVIFIWQGNLQALNNGFFRKFTPTNSKTSINFLDLTIFIHKDRIKQRVFVKRWMLTLFLNQVAISLYGLQTYLGAKLCGFAVIVQTLMNVI